MEALRGETFPASGNSDRFIGGARNYFVRVGKDIGVDHSFLAGLSHLRAEPNGRGAAEHNHGDEEHHGEFGFSGDSDLTIAGLVWKWAPDGNAENRNFLFQTEYFHRDEEGVINFSHDEEGALLPYDGTQQGIYAQGVYQFMPGWRAGLRYDRLWSDNTLRVTDNTTDKADDELLDESGLLGGHDPYRWTFMADYTHSEFSRLRLQYAKDYTRSKDGDDQIQLQYIMSFGAHGAHRY